MGNTGDKYMALAVHQQSNMEDVTALKKRKCTSEVDENDPLFKKPNVVSSTGTPIPLKHKPQDIHLLGQFHQYHHYKTIREHEDDQSSTKSTNKTEEESTCSEYSFKSTSFHETEMSSDTELELDGEIVDAIGTELKPNDPTLFQKAMRMQAALKKTVECQTKTKDRLRATQEKLSRVQMEKSVISGNDVIVRSLVGGIALSDKISS